MTNLKRKSSALLSVLLMAFWFLNLGAMHPYFISVTEIKHKPEEKSLEISSKVFADDIENTLKKLYSTQVDVGASADSIKTQVLLADYFSKHFQLNADGEKLKIDFLGFEKEQDVIWCYMQVSNVRDFKKFCVETKLLYDFIPEQINMVHVILKNGKQSGKANNPDALICIEL